MSFVMDGLAQWVAFKPICPEMAIGLPSPRPALRLVQTTEGDFRLHFSQAPHDDMTEKMAEFTDSYLSHLDELSGFIVCAKSPSCGMERVRLYDEKGNRGRKEGVGVFTRALLEKYSWLPVEEDGRLHDPVLRENFVERIFALHELNTLKANGLTRPCAAGLPQPVQAPTAGAPPSGLSRNWTVCRLVARVGRPGCILRGLSRKTDDDLKKTRFAQEPHQRADAHSRVFS